MGLFRAVGRLLSDPRGFVRALGSEINGPILSRLEGIEGDLARVCAANSVSPQPTGWTRDAIALRFLSGSGLEVGAFNSPLPVPAGTRVTYVDNCSVADAMRSVAVCGLTPADFGLSPETIREPDIIDDGERLGRIGDASYDFVIANHVLEHFEDPLGGFKNMLRVTRDGGVLFISLPDMRRCFDRTRPATTLEHVFRDHEEGPQWSRDQAYREFTEVFVTTGMDKGLFPRRTGNDLEAFLKECDTQIRASGYSIHFHAWTLDTMVEMFQGARRRYRLPFETELVYQNGDEVTLVFRKRL